MKYLEMKKRAFMSIVNAVKGFVRTVSGIPPITLPDCVDEDSLIGYSISGNSVQNGEPTSENPIEIESVGDLTIKNLIKYPYKDTTKTLNGVIFTDNGDGTITVNGTATANTTFNIRDSKTTVWDGVEPNEIYTASLTLEGGYSKSVSFVVNYYPEGSSSYSGWLSASVDKPITKVCPENIAGIRSYIYIPSGATVSNLLIKPQLEKGETATDYEPFGKYKIPIKMSGINLFNPEEVIVKFDSGDTYKSSSYTCTSIQLKPNTTYYLKTFNPTGTKGYFYLSSISNVNGNISFAISVNDDSEQAYPRKNEKSVTTDDTGLMYIGYYSIGGDTERDRILRENQIQIVEGSYTTETAPDYEPYVEPMYITLYLDEPLALGEILEYPKDNIPKLPTIKGTTVYSIETAIQPTNMSAKYYSTSKGE